MKLKILATLAKMMGIQFKVGGLPYGATLNENLSSQRR